MYEKKEYEKYKNETKNSYGCQLLGQAFTITKKLF
jgi:hypothetical protein